VKALADVPPETEMSISVPPPLIVTDPLRESHSRATPPPMYSPSLTIVTDVPVGLAAPWLEGAAQTSAAPTTAKVTANTPPCLPAIEETSP
jgi:hypothetical protein